MATRSKYLEYEDTEDDHDEEEESQALIVSSQIMRLEESSDHRTLTHSFASRLRGLEILLCVILLIVGALLLPYNNWNRHSSSDPLFECPNSVQLTDNLCDEMQREYSQQAEHFSNNVTEFLETFRTQKFDHWSQTLVQQKEAKRPFITKYFAPYLKNDDSIFESAIGIGLNMYLTLEVLKEAKGIDRLTVYGNEYVSVSAEKANIIFDQAPPHQAQKGTICQGDSTSLEGFVPSNAFDLVFTGYVTPLQDPLGFGLEELSNFARYSNLCKSKDEDWKTAKLNDLAQRNGEDWYAVWVGEMIRIAKRGAPVIVEQVQEPFCKPPRKSFPGEGGVAKTWWVEAIDKYQWDVDPQSIVIENDPIKDLDNIRYNIFMLKNREARTTYD
jgi:hypothetical protein